MSCCKRGQNGGGLFRGYLHCAIKRATCSLRSPASTAGGHGFYQIFPAKCCANRLRAVIHIRFLAKGSKCLFYSVHGCKISQMVTVCQGFQSSPQASVGIRQSLRGESEMLPTLGPSGTQLRLNCCWKKRRRKISSVRPISCSEYSPAKAT